jgi:hypothetical protein
MGAYGVWRVVAGSPASTCPPRRRRVSPEPPLLKPAHGHTEGELPVPVESPCCLPAELRNLGCLHNGHCYTSYNVKHRIDDQQGLRRNRTCTCALNQRDCPICGANANDLFIMTSERGDLSQPFSERKQNPIVPVMQRSAFPF